MNIKFEKKGEGKNAFTILSWELEGKLFSLEFSTIARPVYSAVAKRVYVSEYMKSSIYVYSESGELLKKYRIPEKDGYQFRGLNPNKKSCTGVSLLYFPIRDDVGNKWGDIEQYELLDNDPPLGEFIDIYR
ncbi:hypothetical protein [Teredinibacter waterburyi]|uniref:hypothetical protein n=1 Tax=Teredinibacter waterburyi TaxID=1500538 RepID=UPI00166000FB|nr:hypothetical protein [Teredinibacter waterburyi]